MKPIIVLLLGLPVHGLKENSIKTRIETDLVRLYRLHNLRLKEGSIKTRIETYLLRKAIRMAEEGLKEGSIKTRIETGNIPFA